MEFIFYKALWKSWGMKAGIFKVFIELKEDRNLNFHKFLKSVYLYHVITEDWSACTTFAGGTTLTLGSTPSGEKLTTGSWLCGGCWDVTPFGWTTVVPGGICDIVRGFSSFFFNWNWQVITSNKRPMRECIIPEVANMPPTIPQRRTKKPQKDLRWLSTRTINDDMSYLKNIPEIPWLPASWFISRILCVTEYWFVFVTWPLSDLIEVGTILM